MAIPTSAKTLVTGATGKLGRVAVRSLLDRGVPVRVLVRSREAAVALYGSAAEIAVGDFADPVSLRAAADGVANVFLLGPISPDMVAHQTAVIDAAVMAGVGRIAKISGSDWTFGAGGTFSGHSHEAIETHLFASGIPAASVRPNGWIQTSLAGIIDRLRTGEPLFVPEGGTAMSYVDARDIVDVALSHLFADSPTPGVFIITGNEALGARDIAAIATRILGRPVATTDVPPAPPKASGHVNAFELSIIPQFMKLLNAGRGAPVTDTIERVLGRKPRTVEAYLRENLAPAVATEAAE